MIPALSITELRPYLEARQKTLKRALPQLKKRTKIRSYRKELRIVGAVLAALARNKRWFKFRVTIEVGEFFSTSQEPNFQQALGHALASFCERCGVIPFPSSFVITAACPGHDWIPVNGYQALLVNKLEEEIRKRVCSS